MVLVFVHSSERNSKQKHLLLRHSFGPLPATTVSVHLEAIFICSCACASMRWGGPAEEKGILGKRKQKFSSVSIKNHSPSPADVLTSWPCLLSPKHPLPTLPLPQIQQSILTYMASRAAVPAPGHLSRHGRGVLAGLATSYVITSSALMLWSEIFSLFTFKGCVSELGLRSLTRRRNRLAFLLAPVATSLGAAMSSGNQDGGRGWRVNAALLHHHDPSQQLHAPPFSSLCHPNSQVFPSQKHLHDSQRWTHPNTWEICSGPATSSVFLLICTAFGGPAPGSSTEQVLWQEGMEVLQELLTLLGIAVQIPLPTLPPPARFIFPLFWQI